MTERDFKAIYERRRAAGDPNVSGSRGSVLVRIGPELHDRLQAAATEHERSMNWLVKRAVSEYLDRLIPADEVRFTR